MQGGCRVTESFSHVGARGQAGGRDLFGALVLACRHSRIPLGERVAGEQQKEGYEQGELSGAPPGGERVRPMS